MTTKKQPSRRTPQKRSAAQDSPAKNFATTRAKKVTKKAAARKTAPKKAPAAVRLPNNMSQRAIEKSIVYKREFDHHYRRSMYQIAYVTGLCFMLIGGAFAGSALYSDMVPPVQVAQISKTLDDQTQQLDDSLKQQTTDLSGSTQAVQTTTSTQTLQPTSIPDPMVKLLDPLPSELKDKRAFEAEARYTNSFVVKVKVISGGTGFMPDPAVEERTNDRFRFTIPADIYPPGTYQLILIADGDNGNTRSFPSGYFKVPSATGATIAEPDVEEVTIDPDTGLIDITTVEPDDTDEPVFVDPSPVTVEFSIFKSTTLLTGIQTIGVNVPEEYTYIELYARPSSGGGNARFIGLASKRFDRWQFVVDTTTIPNGEYDFFAQTKNSSGSTLNTKPLRLRVENVNSITEEPISTVPIRQQIDDSNTLTLEEQEPLAPLRTFEVETEESERETDEGMIRASTDEPERLYRENRESLEVLFEKYTDAQKSGDEEALQTAREDLRQKREELTNLAVADQQEDRDRISRELEERIEDFEDRVTRFEGIRKERIERQEAADQDTDGDGISDVDERQLYGTDPENADSDGDGLPDGIELVRGFNPRSESPEEVIRFESPKLTIGLQRDDQLVIDAVTAITREPEDGSSVAEAAPVRTEIRGKALPNSFVTLYIFSTPTVVTIKTDADGSFVYTFDKELEDGEHDVYVAVTDNTGEIVAQSAPFSFIKRAEAFTPVDAAEAEVVTTETIVDTAARGYNVAIGIGILALGLILLMLGIGLRTKDEELEKITITDTVEGEGEDAQPEPKPAKRTEHIDAT